MFIQTHRNETTWTVDDQFSKMVEINSDVKTMDIPINMQRVFNPLVEAATLRLQDTPIGNFNVAIDDVNVSSIFTHSLSQPTNQFCLWSFGRGASKAKKQK